MTYGPNKLKVCKSCGETKPLDMFGVRKGCLDDRQPRCRVCLNKVTLEFRRKKHEEYKHKKRDITLELATEYFEYKDGGLYWKKQTHPKTIIGSKCGTVDNKGYIKISFFGKKYFEHKIVYLLNYGFIPKEIDHANCNKADNRIENLRSVTRSQNMKNKKFTVNNTTGYKNVYWEKKLNKWQVTIAYNNKKKYIGVFEDIDLADLVATEARNKYHGIYANHGV